MRYWDKPTIETATQVSQRLENAHIYYRWPSDPVVLMHPVIQWAKGRSAWKFSVPGLNESLALVDTGQIVRKEELSNFHIEMQE